MKLHAFINHQPAGISKKGTPYAAFIHVRGTSPGITDKAFEFTVNEPKAVEELASIGHAFSEKRVAPVLEITGGTIAAVPTMTTDGGIRRAQTWAGRPVHSIDGKITYDVVGKEPLPTAEPAADLLAKATKILDG